MEEKKKKKLKLNKNPETFQDILDDLEFLWEENKRLKKTIRELRKKLKEFGNSEKVS